MYQNNVMHLLPAVQGMLFFVRPPQSPPNNTLASLNLVEFLPQLDQHIIRPILSTLK